MKAMLAEDLKASGRPFGEFIPGGNAAPPGQIDPQIAQVKKMKIDGKKVTVPDDEAAKPAPPAESKKEMRKKRKADQ